jgi:hypothetical protein
MNIKQVIESYTECLLWSETDDNQCPIDENYDFEDISEETEAQIKEDCENFISLANNYIKAAKLDEEEIGHDFCLTRNHHGAGFWDRGLGKEGEALTKIAHSFGSMRIYVGDDNKLYHHG